MNKRVAFCLKHGAEYPYDGEDGTYAAPPATDQAHATARGILADLTDRRGIKHELEKIDYEVRRELVETMAAIIREGMKDAK